MLEELCARAVTHPKPLYYRPDFLDNNLGDYMRERALKSAEEIEPDDFARWIFPRLVAWRIPRYDAIATRYGITIDAGRIEDLRNEEQVIDLIAAALDRRS
jgi:hypothetical protein